MKKILSFLALSFMATSFVAAAPAKADENGKNRSYKSENTDSKKGTKDESLFKCKNCGKRSRG